MFLPQTCTCVQIILWLQSQKAHLTERKGDQNLLGKRCKDGESKSVREIPKERAKDTQQKRKCYMHQKMYKVPLRNERNTPLQPFFLWLGEDGNHFNFLQPESIFLLKRYFGYHNMEKDKVVRITNSCLICK